jgi:hypothetical protein
VDRVTVQRLRDALDLHLASLRAEATSALVYLQELLCGPHAAQMKLARILVCLALLLVDNLMKGAAYRVI